MPNYSLPHIFVVSTTLIFVVLSLAIVSSAQGQSLRWYKGNTHTHTLNSDGDSPPEAVVKWYSDNRYNFLFITDHEFLTPVEPLNQRFGRAGEFLVMQAQEVTDALNGKPIHVNGLGLSRVCMPAKGTTIPDNLQKNIDCIRAAGGVPQINHPNFGWALSARDIIATRNVMLLDIHNGHPLVNNIGGGGSPGTEAIWDEVLSSGRLIYGVAVDDSHFFKRLGDRSVPTPGQAWVYVRASELSQTAILAALERGDFYASTGVELNDIKFDGRSLTITIREEKASKYTIQFIGGNGRVLTTVTTNPAVYSLRGNESYVRVKVVESNGKIAWTQPVFPKKK